MVSDIHIQTSSTIRVEEEIPWECEPPKLISILPISKHLGFSLELLTARPLFVDNLKRVIRKFSYGATLVEYSEGSTKEAR